jgi:hypothetical protein
MLSFQRSQSFVCFLVATHTLEFFSYIGSSVDFLTVNLVCQLWVQGNTGESKAKEQHQRRRSMDVYAI